MMRRLMLVLLALMGAASVAAAADGYRLRPGDRLEVTVWQEPKLNRIITVAPDGGISFPLVGHLRAGGRTVETVEAAIKAGLAKQYTTDIDVNVAIAEVKERPVKPVEKILPGIYVTGEVAKPGRYEYRGSVNVLQAIALAGGLGPFAAPKRIKVRRGGGIYDFNYDAAVSGEGASHVMQLRSGDVVVVPERGLFE